MGTFRSQSLNSVHRAAPHQTGRYGWITLWATQISWRHCDVHILEAVIISRDLTIAHSDNAFIQLGVSLQRRLLYIFMGMGGVWAILGELLRIAATSTMREEGF